MPHTHLADASHVCQATEIKVTEYDSWSATMSQIPAAMTAVQTDDFMVLHVSYLQEYLFSHDDDSSQPVNRNSHEYGYKFHSWIESVSVSCLSKLARLIWISFYWNLVSFARINLQVADPSRYKPLGSDAATA